MVAAVLLAVAGCTGAPRHGADAPPAPAPVTPTPSTAGGSAACPATAQVSGLEERQGVGDGVTLWALLFPTDPTVTAGREIKIAWRMTGDGTPTMRAVGPGGRVVRPVWGPEGHGGSTWTRPGDEWGTGWVFPAPGCWTVEARRSSGSARLTLRAG